MKMQMLPIKPIQRSERKRKPSKVYTEQGEREKQRRIRQVEAGKLQMRGTDEFGEDTIPCE